MSIWNFFICVLLQSFGFGFHFYVYFRVWHHGRKEPGLPSASTSVLNHGHDRKPEGEPSFIINDLLSSTMYFLWLSVFIISSLGWSLSPVRGGVMINLLQLFMAEEEKVKVERLIWKRKAFLEMFIYSLTSLSLTLYVVFVSFVHVLNPLLNLSRSGGPRRLWGCSWTSRGPMQTLGSTLITRVTSYLCYFFQVLPRRWCEWKRYLNQVLIILIYIPSYMFYTWNILILTSTLPFSMVQVD